MKRLMLATALSAFAFVAAAQTPNAQVQVEASVQADAPQAEVRVDANANADTQAQPAKKKLSDAYCLRQTGSRIQSKAKQDCAAHGRSYSRDDINGTGEVDVASALRKLDPAVH